MGPCHGPFGEKIAQITEWGTEVQWLAQVLPLVTGGVRTEPRRSGSESVCQSQCCTASRRGWDEVPLSGFLSHRGVSSCATGTASTDEAVVVHAAPRGSCHRKGSNKAANHGSG